jgi:hypothetical protein
MLSHVMKFLSYRLKQGDIIHFFIDSVKLIILFNDK